MRSGERPACRAARSWRPAPPACALGRLAPGFGPLPWHQLLAGLDLQAPAQHPPCRQLPAGSPAPRPLAQPPPPPPLLARSRAGAGRGHRRRQEPQGPAERHCRRRVRGPAGQGPGVCRLRPGGCWAPQAARPLAAFERAAQRRASCLLVCGSRAAAAPQARLAQLSRIQLKLPRCPHPAAPPLQAKWEQSDNKPGLVATGVAGLVGLYLASGLLNTCALAASSCTACTAEEALALLTNQHEATSPKRPLVSSPLQRGPPAPVQQDL